MHAPHTPHATPLPTSLTFTLILTQSRARFVFAGRMNYPTMSAKEKREEERRELEQRNAAQVAAQVAAQEIMFPPLAPPVPAFRFAALSQTQPPFLPVEHTQHMPGQPEQQKKCSAASCRRTLDARSFFRTCEPCRNIQRRHYVSAAHPTRSGISPGHLVADPAAFPAS